ncbi:MAG: hypothetical protein AAFX06_29240 [Planctomycetota bacterium]
MKTQSHRTTSHRLALFALLFSTTLWSTSLFAQDDTETSAKSGSTIILETRDPPPEPPLFYTANANARVKVGAERIEQDIRLNIKIVQGKPDTLSFGINGGGTVKEVSGDGLVSWSVRQSDAGRFLDLQVKEDVEKLNPVVKIVSDEIRLPATIELSHLTPGDSIGFNSVVVVQYNGGVVANVNELAGFVPLDDVEAMDRFQTATGGRIILALNRAGAAPADVELTETKLAGLLHPNGNSVDFEFRGTARVAKAGAELILLSGAAAISQIPADENYRLQLGTVDDQVAYKLTFEKAGEFPVALDFVARLGSPGANRHTMDFTVAAGAVVPITLSGFDEDLQFLGDEETVVPMRSGDDWLGFLPASGRARLQWKTARQSGESKLFFTTTGQTETQVGAGLLRQNHQINYQVLQGELKSISVLLRGPGEILDVQGPNILSWNVSEEGEERKLDLVLSQSVTANTQINVRSQTPLDAFPVRVEGLRLEPTGAIRHSGYLRLSNLGSVRLEPTDLEGLTQLAPDQFPGGAIKARQVFVYRFPAANHAFTIAADRIQPEISVSQLVLYQLAETDRVILADVELDIREAPIREWDVEIPADYSVVSVTGANIADYIAASEEGDGKRNLKVIFGKDVAGRQLVSLHLEKSQPAAAEDWTLPRLEYPEAKSVRGDIGIVGAPGFRLSVSASDLLVEKPLSYFPKPVSNLQQAFRIREPGWNATMTIELLQRSVQSDVFHLYSLGQETVYGSALINYLVTGAPVSEWRITVPQDLGNVMVDGQDVRTWRREDDTLIVSLHQPVMGAYTLLVTYEKKPDADDGSFNAGTIVPLDVQGERGFIQVVSPMQVEIGTEAISEDLLKLDPLELPAEFRLLSTAPPLGTWQYTERPFTLGLKVTWFQPGSIATQIVEFSEANSRVSKDGELVTDVVYYVKSRGQRSLKIRLPGAPVRLWDVAVDGQPVTARETDEATVIPLPGTDPNVPIEVKLRLGKPAVDESNPELTLPVVFAPVLKTQWNVSGDEQYVLVPRGGNVSPPEAVLSPSGFEWVAHRGMIFLVTAGLLTLAGVILCGRSVWLRVVGLCLLIAAISAAVAGTNDAWRDIGRPAALGLSLPVLAAGEAVELQVENMPLWQSDLNAAGIAAIIGGVLLLAFTFIRSQSPASRIARGFAAALILAGILAQGDGAAFFFAALAAGILLLLVLPSAWACKTEVTDWWRRIAEKRKAKRESKKGTPPTDAGAATATALLLALVMPWTNTTLASDFDGVRFADAMEQTWSVTDEDARLVAKGKIKLTGKPGDQFLLLQGPAVLTRFEGDGLRLSKKRISESDLGYFVSIPVDPTRVVASEDETEEENTEQNDDEAANEIETQSYEATFEYRLEAISPTGGLPVLTGAAALQTVELEYDQPGWDVVCTNAMRVESRENDGKTSATILLSPGDALIEFRPKARDVTTEATQFFVEASNLYVPGPGVVDGRHRLQVRPSQGQVRELIVEVPDGLTVSSVAGPVGSWQFDADGGQLKIEIEPAQAKTFDILIETQRGLEPLPVDLTLAPLNVNDADGEVGLIAVAFGPDAQPEKLDADQMSAVNLGDFDASLLNDQQAVLHRVYRYGADGGSLSLRVGPVAPEVRVISKQVLSLGDERVVLGVNFVAEITRAGLFQLSFRLPDGLEVESLSGASLHHWSELSDDDGRSIILHLNGKTIGAQNFALTLTGNAPADASEWEIPRFELEDAARQTGELVVRPTTGIRLRTVTRQNISETDPRTLGGRGQGALAFRLLQRDWNLVLGIEKLDPWITGQLLHEITVREGQTRTNLIANFNVQNASIRSLQVRLPVTDEDVIKTLRATGDIVSDFIRTAEDSDIWEVQFKRRVVGSVPFRIEYERRGERVSDRETLAPIEFPQARQLNYFFGIRAGGRLELEHDELTLGWQRADWNAVPQSLRESGNRTAPALVLRAVTPAETLGVLVKRHSLADALKLRVAQGNLTTVLSPTGDQVTSVDVTMEVIQRSSLTVGLPAGGELFNIFVNGESVNSIRLGGNSNAWQFYILPGMDDRTASVRFVYSLTGDQLTKLNLVSPELNVPLENIEWNVIAPKGFELIDDQGNLELVRQAAQEGNDRSAYLSKVSGRRQVQAQQAAQLLEQANMLLQAGQQSKAQRALNSVANQYALDAASNEDARVQLENLQTQQAIVGLNTRRQRLYLDNTDSILLDNKQLRQAAAENPVLQLNDLNFRPQQLSQLLQGNTSEDNKVLQQIAVRLVQHQRTTEPAPQAILISLPEEGTAYTFRRTVQVAENAPLELDLDFALQRRLRVWQIALACAAILLIVVAFTVTPGNKASAS